MDNVSHQHHGNIEKLNKHDTIKIIHLMKNVTILRLSKTSVMSLISWEICMTNDSLEDLNSKPMPCRLLLKLH